MRQITASPLHSPMEWNEIWSVIGCAILLGQTLNLGGVARLPNPHQKCQDIVVSAEVLVVFYRLLCSDQGWQVNSR